MTKLPMYPLRFEPIYQYRLWGGRRLAELLTAPLPGDGPIGEAWLLSLPDRFDIYYGMADNRIGVARLDVPEFLPTGALADLPRAKGSLHIDGRPERESRRQAPITIRGGSSPT